jgi:hypothetical protein
MRTSCCDAARLEASGFEKFRLTRTYPRTREAAYPCPPDRTRRPPRACRECQRATLSPELVLRAGVVEAKLRELKRAVKADFDPNQPRVPAGSGCRRSSPIGTNSGFITYTQQDQATAERWRDALVQNYPTVMNTEKIAVLGGDSVGANRPSCP